MSVESEVVKGVETQKQYVCFVKKCAGAEFVPYMSRDNPDVLLAKTKREFLDREIDVWFTASSKGPIDTAVVAKISHEMFVKDVNESFMNSKLAAMLGWNYASAFRMAESEGWVFLLTVHPRFESVPFSFCMVRDDDHYATLFVEKMFSVRGGEIAFEEYDPAKHVAGYRYEPM